MLGVHKATSNPWVSVSVGIGLDWATSPGASNWRDGGVFSHRGTWIDRCSRLLLRGG